MTSALRTGVLLCVGVLVLVCTAAFTSHAVTRETRALTPEFRVFDVYLDAGDVPLAAWQIEVSIADEHGASHATLVGVEGGEHAAFAQPAYYDPAALHEDQIADRIVLAAFSTHKADALPHGRTRVARLHVMLDEDAQCRSHATLVASATTDAQPINATVEVIPVDGGTR